jgi:hypothetical protein
MRIGAKIFIFCCVLFVMNGCQSSSTTQIEVKLKSKKEQEYLASYTYNDYKKAYDEVLSEAKTFQEKDESLNKWIIRTLAQEKLYYKTDLTKNQVVQLSKQDEKEYKLWKSIANDKYNVKVEKEELDRYIDEFESTNPPSKQAFAASLGITAKELDHTFEREIFEKGFIWIKLHSKLAKKYDTTDEEMLKRKYEEEVRKSMEG